MDVLLKKISKMKLLNDAIIAINQFRRSQGSKKKSTKSVVVDLEKWFNDLKKEDILNKDIEFSDFENLCQPINYNKNNSDFVSDLKRKIEENRVDMIKYINENFHDQVVLSDNDFNDDNVRVLRDILSKSPFIDVMESVKKNITILPASKYASDIKNRLTFAKKQLELEELLSYFKIPFTPLSETKPPEPGLRNRIFYTTSDDTIDGLKALKIWYDFTQRQDKDRDKSPAETVKSCTPTQVLSDLDLINSENPDLKIEKNKIEIAWGHLTSMNQHTKTEAPPYFVVNMPALEHALEQCQKDSTLVIDGHGGTNYITLGEFNRTTMDKAVFYLDKVNSMKGMSNISHVMLNACTTGILNKELSDTIYKKSAFYKEKHPGTQNNVMFSEFKDRYKYYFNPEEGNFSEKFEHSAFLKGEPGLAAKLSDLFLKKNKASEARPQGMAFTFSPSLLNPDTKFGGNKASIKRKEFDSSTWYQTDKSWEEDERLKHPSTTTRSQIAAKSVTIVNSLNNRKAPELNEDKTIVAWRRPHHKK